jgi:hypothetical protein
LATSGTFLELLVHLAGAAARLIDLAFSRTQEAASCVQEKPVSTQHKPAITTRVVSDRRQPRDARGRFAKKDWTKVESYGIATKEEAPA